MRFSLLTLILVTLWIAVALLVWTQREPWVMRFVSTPIPANLPFPGVVDGGHPMPDGRRVLGPLVDEKRSSGINTIRAFDFFVIDKDSRTNLYQFQNVEMHSDSMVIHSNDAFEVNLGTDNGFGHAHYRRRFPEWWWGHFYRPEVWALIGLTLVIAWRGVKRSRATP